MTCTHISGTPSDYHDVDLLVALSFVGCSLGLGFGVLNSGLYLGIIGCGCGFIFSVLGLYYVKRSPRPLIRWKAPPSKKETCVWEHMWTNEGN